ncbi:hypothetical protein TNCV_1716781 [Trichonephila clavipes]|nr:hypothetical protein TNCV_1716781 [Trichonephila clavipes]
MINFVGIDLVFADQVALVTTTEQPRKPSSDAEHPNYVPSIFASMKDKGSLSSMKRYNRQVVSFVSKLYGRRTSDKQLIQLSGSLEQIRPGDVIFADRGFPVKDLVAERGLPWYCQLLLRTALRSNGLFASIFDGLVAFAMDRWRHDCGARRVWIISRPGSPMSEGRFDLSTFRSERTNEASTLTITPKRSSSPDVGTSSYRYHTATISFLSNKTSEDTCIGDDVTFVIAALCNILKGCLIRQI